MFTELRKRAGISQSELADKLGVKQNAVSNWETGQAKPKLDTIKKLAEILQVSVEEIVECF